VVGLVVDDDDAVLCVMIGTCVRVWRGFASSMKQDLWCQLHNINRAEEPTLGGERNLEPKQTHSY